MSGLCKRWYAMMASYNNALQSTPEPLRGSGAPERHR